MKNRKFITILLMVVLISINSCKNEINKSFCNNEKVLLNPNNKLKTLKISLEKLNDSLLIDNGFDLNCVSPKKQEFNILVNNLKIKAFVRRNCCLCIPKNIPITTILVNNEGKVLISSKKDTIIETDKIPEWFKKNYTKEVNGERIIKQIGLRWGKNTNKKNLYNAIQKIIKGYLIYINEISVKEYGKKICELKKSELTKIKEILPFEIKLVNFNKNQNDIKINLKKSVIEK